MSDASKPILDLSDLRLAPKWVSDFSKPTRSEQDFSSRESSERRSSRDRDSRSGNFRGRDNRSGGPRGAQGDRSPRDRKDFNRRPDSKDRRDSDRQGRRHEGQGRFKDRQEQQIRLIPNLTVSVAPELKATEAIATMIKSAGKAYSVFEAAKLILASGDRFVVKYQFAEEETTYLYAVPSTSSLWLTKEEAANHLLHHELLETYYKKEEIELEAPKGNYTSVAICGFSGLPLGPTSHHSFQTNVHRIHREKFSHLSLEDYKKRIRVDNTPEAIQAWKDSVSKGYTYTYLKGEEGAEPVVLKSQSEMEHHFRVNHLESLIQEVKEAAVAGNIPKQLLSPALYLHLRKAVDEARKHLLQIAQLLCSIFEQMGLKLFKRRGGKLWVSKTRPRALDPSVTLSEPIAKLVELVKANPGIKSQALIELVAPSEAAADSTEPAAAEESAPATQPTDTAEVTEAEATKSDESAAPAQEAAAEGEGKTLTDAQVQALKDLHWLNSEGYVIEYADGVVFPGVTEPPPPKPKTPKVKAEKKEETETPEAPAPSEWDEAPAESVEASENQEVTEGAAPEASSEASPAEESSTEEASS